MGHVHGAFGWLESGQRGRGKMVSSSFRGETSNGQSISQCQRLVDPKGKGLDVDSGHVSITTHLSKEI